MTPAEARRTGNSDFDAIPVGDPPMEVPTIVGGRVQVVQGDRIVAIWVLSGYGTSCLAALAPDDARALGRRLAWAADASETPP